MARLQLYLLGSFQAMLDGVPISGFRSTQTRALFAYLAVASSQAHARKTLMTLLWGDYPEHAAQASLRQALTSLRRILAPLAQDAALTPARQLLTTTRQQVTFEADWQVCWIDVAAFDGLLAAAYPLPGYGAVVPADSIRRLAEAVELYRGNFLTGMEQVGSASFEEWRFRQQETRHQQMLTALTTLVSHHMACGQYEQVQHYARRHIDLEPWHEEPHRQLMRALALSGQRSAAMAHFETCRRLLAQELGVEPDSETHRLLHTIRDGTSIPPLTQELPRSRQSLVLPQATPRQNVPVPITPLIGRESELPYLRQCLLDPAYRLVTLVGLGGIGKTRLALSTAEQLVGRFADGVWFVPLDGVYGNSHSSSTHSYELLAIALAEHLGLTFQGHADPVAQMLNYLRGKEMLIVFDNFEHLLAGGDFLRDILATAPLVTLLITSRERLLFQAEYVLQVEGLPVPLSIHDPAASDYTSVQLFVERATRMQSNFLLNATTLPAVVQICQLTEGLPLAIELAASRVGYLPVEQIARTIQHDLDTLRTTMRDIPARHRSMRAVFAGSWHILSEAERSTLAEVSVFQGGFTPEAAIAVASAAAAATTAALHTLVDKSLLRWNSVGRYGIHELLRQYAAKQLETTAQVQTQVQARHCAYYAAFLQQRETRLLQQRQALLEIKPEEENIRAAWEWAVWHDQFAALRQSISGLLRFYVLAGLLHEGVAVFGRAIEHLTTHDPPSQPERAAVLSLLHASRAELLLELAQYERVCADSEQAVEYARHGNIVVSAAAGYLQCGKALLEQAHYAIAQAQLMQALLLSRSAVQPLLEAESLHWLGMLLMQREEFARAQDHLQQAWRFYRADGNQRGESRILNGLGMIALNLGDVVHAHTCLMQALHLYRELGDRHGEGLVLSNLCESALHCGDFANAQVYADHALHLCRETGNRAGEAWTLTHLSLLYHQIGDNEASRITSQQAIHLAQDIGARLQQVSALTFLGHALLELNHQRQAQHAYQRALELWQALNMSSLALEQIAGLARVALYQGDVSDARSYTELLLDYLDPGTLQRLHEPLRVYTTCYQVLKVTDTRRAREVLTEAYRVLHSWADRISDSRTRRLFLEYIPTHRDLLAEYQATLIEIDARHHY